MTAQLIQAIVDIAGDYRPRPMTTAHVEQWLQQFSPALHEPLLAELVHVLKRTYFSEGYVREFLATLLRSKGLHEPETYWKGVQFLHLQEVGNSQNDLLEILSELLQAEFGFALDQCGAKPHSYMYVDDAIFSGGRVKSDLIGWIETDAPQNATVNVVTIARHTQGSFFCEGDIAAAAAAAGKNIALRFPSRFIIEDRRARTNTSDVLRPVALPDDPATQEYVEQLGREPVFRAPGSVGTQSFFSSEAGRHVLEQEMLKAGVAIRGMCPLLNKYQRPLGNTLQKTMGFGSTIVTFRNCPNNAPLALWAGPPWYPLFSRETN